MGTFSCFALPGGHFCTGVLNRGALPVLGTGTRTVTLAVGTGAGQNWTREVGQRGAESYPGEKAGGSVPALGPLPAVATPGRPPADIFQVRRQHVPAGRE